VPSPDPPIVKKKWRGQLCPPWVLSYCCYTSLLVNKNKKGKKNIPRPNDTYHHLALSITAILPFSSSPTPFLYPVSSLCMFAHASAGGEA
jgi:hypothetical protein